MHPNEMFLKRATADEIAELQLFAEAQGSKHVEALNEQCARLGITV